MKEIIFFSNNKNKINEISSLFNDASLKILSLLDYNKVKSPEELGLTFEENAKIKSSFGFKRFKKICFADDSGICIKALNNGPGVNSKNFLGSKENHKRALNKIIKESKANNMYEAYFQTTICLSLDADEDLLFTGKIFGKISNKIKGERGFGYDPIFIPRGYDKTFAEMDLNEKNKISHRSIAVGKLIDYFKSLI